MKTGVMRCCLFTWCLVFLIGYGAVAGFNVGNVNPPHYTLYKGYSKNGTVARIGRSSMGKKGDYGKC
jgi:hypothetical protein